MKTTITNTKLSSPSKLRYASLSLLLGLALGPAALAQAPGAPAANGSTRVVGPAATRAGSFGDQCRRADLIFEGTVTDIRYRSSDVRSGADLRVPHTFVTFDVQRVFKGGISGSANGKLTLRFLGGEDGTGRRLRVAHAPEFELGSREILLVQNSEVWGIPLVAGDLRRFTVLGGSESTEERVLSEGGRALEFANGTLRMRPSDKANEAHAHGLQQERARSMTPDLFRAALEGVIRESHDAQTFFSVQPVATVAFERPFYVAAPTERAPVVRAADLAQPVEELESRR